MYIKSRKNHTFPWSGKNKECQDWPGWETQVHIFWEGFKGLFMCMRWLFCYKLRVFPANQIHPTHFFPTKAVRNRGDPDWWSTMFCDYLALVSQSSRFVVWQSCLSRHGNPDYFHTLSPVVEHLFSTPLLSHLLLLLSTSPPFFFISLHTPSPWLCTVALKLGSLGL